MEQANGRFLLFWGAKHRGLPQPEGFLDPLSLLNVRETTDNRGAFDCRLLTCSASPFDSFSHLLLQGQLLRGPCEGCRCGPNYGHPPRPVVFFFGVTGLSEGPKTGPFPDSQRFISQIQQECVCPTLLVSGY